MAVTDGRGCNVHLYQTYHLQDYGATPPHNTIRQAISMHHLRGIDIQDELELLGIECTDEVQNLVGEYSEEFYDEEPDEFYEEELENTQEQPMSFMYSTFLANENNYDYSDPDIHIGFGSSTRLQEAKRNFDRSILPRNSMNLFCGSVRTKKRYVEDISRVTCSSCLAVAREIGWGEAVTGQIRGRVVSNNPSSTLLHRDSVTNVVSWIPSDCSIIIADSKIIVKDGKLDTDSEVKNLREACVLIVDDFFEPFDSDSVLGNTSLFSKTVVSNSGKKFGVQGFKYDSKTQTIDGLILGQNGKNLTEVSFVNLFHQGYHFSNGSPCGKYVDDRTPRVVEQQTGVSISDIDMSMIGLE